MTRPLLRPAARAAAALALALAAGACGGPAHLKHLSDPDRGPVSCAGGCRDTVEVRFLGTGGFLVRLGDDAVMTGVLFSNPRLGRITLPLSVRADTARIDAGMRAHLSPDDLRAVRAVLVGHSHYDHLMDVPYAARRYLPGVPIYGNRAMRHLLAADPVYPRLVAVDSLAGSVDAPGRWIYPGAEGPGATGTQADSTLRLMAVRTEHVPHALGVVKLFRRDQTTPRPDLPGNAWQWAEGRPHAFVVEFLDPATRGVRFRLYYTDASANPPHGFPPPLAEGAGAYDAALLCVGNFEQVRLPHPGPLLRHLRPRHAVLGHWENFFRPQSAPVRPLPALDLDEFVRRVDAELPGGENRTLPLPGQTVRVCVCESVSVRPGSDAAAA